MVPELADDHFIDQSAATVSDVPADLHGRVNGVLHALQKELLHEMPPAVNGKPRLEK